MKSKLTALLAIAAVFAVSAVSCGEDKPNDNVTPDLPVLVTEAESTEPAATTETKNEQTTEASTEAETEAETTTEETVETTTEAEETTEAPEEATEPEPEPEPEPAPQPQGVSFGFGTLHSEAGGIISALGEPTNVTSAPACFSNGADSKIYEYDGLRIECYVLDGIEKVYCVTITSSSYSTDTGITIDSSQADVEAAYGAGEASGAYTIYRNGNSELDVKYDGGAVTEILFYTAV